MSGAHGIFARRGPNNPGGTNAPPCEHECRCGLKVSHRDWSSDCGGGCCVGFEVMRLHLDLEDERTARNRRRAGV